MRWLALPAGLGFRARINKASSQPALDANTSGGIMPMASRSRIVALEASLASYKNPDAVNGSSGGTLCWNIFETFIKERQKY